MNNDQPGRAGATGAFGSLFSHDDTDHQTSGEASDEQRHAYRKSDDEAGPGRPLELKFSGDGEPDRRAAS